MKADEAAAMSMLVEKLQQGQLTPAQFLEEATTSTAEPAPVDVAQPTTATDGERRASRALRKIRSL
jgi:hypothetical protein